MGVAQPGTLNTLRDQFDDCQGKPMRPESTMQIWLLFLNIQNQGGNKAIFGQTLGFDMSEAWLAHEQVISSFG